jgi:hypothetical protein
MSSHIQIYEPGGISMSKFNAKIIIVKNGRVIEVQKSFDHEHPHYGYHRDEYIGNAQERRLIKEMDQQLAHK